jgi:hypothetical protein
MEIDQTCFAKFIDVVGGAEFYIKTLPCVVGRYSNVDGIKDKKNLNGKTIDIDYNNYKEYNIADYRVHCKLILDKCKRM